MSRWTVLLISVIAGCGPLAVQGTESELCGATDCGDHATGVLTESGFRVEWEWYDPWTSGTCARVRVTNTGAPVVWWSVDLTLNEPLEGLTHRDPEDGVFASGATLTLSPAESGKLDRGGRATFYYCAEPKTWPVQVDVQAVSADGQDLGGGETGEPTGFGTLIDAGGDVGLTWTRRPDDCVDLTVVNLTRQEVSAWDLHLTLSESVGLTGGAGFFPTLDDSDLRLRPTAVNAEIRPNGSVSGSVCLDGPVDVTGLEASYTLADPAVEPDPVDDPDETDVDAGGDDTTAPFIRNIQGELTRNDTQLAITFDTDEIATGMVCDSQLRCEWTQTDGLSHRVEMPYRAEIYTIRATDVAGNVREVGPVQF